MIGENLKSIRQRIARACEKALRQPDEVKLVCVTKEANLEEINELLGSGEKSVGENRVQEALSKYRIIGDKADWHLVGHLQTNKTKDAVRMFSLIHSVDSARLARKIDEEARKINKIQDVLIQVNASGEDSKFGLAPDELEAFLKEAAAFNNISIKGLMTIAPESGNPEEARPCFKKLREIMARINSLQLTTYNLQLLSMGMSGDFEVAIEEGSNMVRIGRAIFKDDR